MSIDTNVGAEPQIHGSGPAHSSAESRQWTARVRRAAESAFPPDQLLPDRQPAYMASWIYVFGVLTVVSLAWVIITGCILAIMGPTLVARLRQPGTSSTPCTCGASRPSSSSW